MPSPNREEGRVPSLSEGMGDPEAGGGAAVCSRPRLTAPTPAVHTSTRPHVHAGRHGSQSTRRARLSFPGRMAGACAHLCRECLGLSPEGPSGCGSLS